MGGKAAGARKRKSVATLPLNPRRSVATLQLEKTRRESQARMATGRRKSFAQLPQTARSGRSSRGYVSLLVRCLAHLPMQCVPVSDVPRCVCFRSVLSWLRLF